MRKSTALLVLVCMLLCSVSVYADNGEQNANSLI